MSAVGVVESWFGQRFGTLHPMLQALHRSGGTLEGEVDIRFGDGIAGALGRRLAQRVGIPPTPGRHLLRVDIRDDGTSLHWDRCFDHASWMRSRFEPNGAWPRGYWLETTGPLQLRLTVDVINASWRWRTLGIRLYGVPVPRWLMPRTHAHKCVEAGRYRFQVAFELPVIGEVLTYGGLLDIAPTRSVA